MNHEIDAYLTGELDAPGLLTRFDGIAGCIQEAQRGWMEEIFEERLETLPSSNLELRLRRLVLCLTAMVGKFSQTSREKEYAVDNKYTYYYYGVTTSGTKYTFKKPPRPRSWCKHLVNELDMQVGRCVPLHESECPVSRLSAGGFGGELEGGAGGEACMAGSGGL